MVPTSYGAGETAVDKMKNAPGFRRQVGIVRDYDQTGLIFLIQREHQIKHALCGMPIEIAGRFVR